jgi:hypothetical protein
LRDTLGDSIYALLSAAGMNFGKLLGFPLAFFLNLLNSLLPGERQPCVA